MMKWLTAVLVALLLSAATAVEIDSDLDELLDEPALMEDAQVEQGEAKGRHKELDGVTGLIGKLMARLRGERKTETVSKRDAQETIKTMQDRISAIDDRAVTNDREMQLLQKILDMVNHLNGNGFTSVNGVKRFSAWGSGTKCSRISFPRSFSQPPVVTATIDHRSYTGSGTHDATTLWIQDISKDSFKACVRELHMHGSGGHDNNLHVTWSAMKRQESSGKSVVRSVNMPSWSKGTHCKWAKYGTTLSNARVIPTIFHDPKRGGDALTVWSQQVESSRFRVCVRETKHHGRGGHDPIRIGFVAWSGNTNMVAGAANGETLIKNWGGGSKCQTVNYGKTFSGLPNVQAGINHRHASSATHDSVTVWLENVRSGSFRLCVRELAHHGRGAHDKLYVDWIAAPQK